MNRTILILIFGDFLSSLISIYAGSAVRFRSFTQLEDSLYWKPEEMIVFILVLLFSSHLLEIYDSNKTTGKKELLVRIFIAVTASFILMSVIYYLFPAVMIGRGLLVLSLFIFGSLQSLWHIVYRWYANIPGLAKRVLVLGTGPLAEKIGVLITSTNHNHLLGGYINYSSEAAHVPLHSIVGNGGGLVDTVRKEKAKKIVISLSERRGCLPIKELLACKLSGVEVVDAPSFYEELTGKLLIEDIKPSWFVLSDGFRKTNFRSVSKRIFDSLFAAVCLIITVLFMPIIALLIKLDSRGPVFFKQIRTGEGGKEFLIYKFRTMRQDAESETGAVWAQENDTRVTRIGRMLRKSRLDELPQLFNVLKGDMSFIGPRPERPEMIKELEEMIPYYSERHSVKPGITGWAQVKYSYGASVEDAMEKLKYDLFYVKHNSLFLDLLIMLETVKVVLFGRGGR
jgi:sugar transferase (PEP-CTERM system associated)